MTKKEQQAMIARKKAEAEKKKTTEQANQQVEPSPKSGPTPKTKPEQQTEQEEVIITLFSDVDFEIDYCTDQETITDKIIYLADQEKEILSKFKNREPILKNGIYKELYDTIIDVFGYYLMILRNRLDLIVKSEKQQAAMNRLQFIVGKLKQNKIDNKFQVKMLKYQNWLYFWRKWREHGIERKREKARYKAEIKALKEQAALELKKAKMKKTKVECKPMSEPKLKEKQHVQEKKKANEGVVMSP